MRLSEAWGKSYEMNISIERLRRSHTFVVLKSDTHNRASEKRNISS
ncbi:MAG: hypothetical protein ACK4GN_11995 [Runella sp.]